METVYTVIYNVSNEKTASLSKKWKMFEYVKDAYDSILDFIETYNNMVAETQDEFVFVMQNHFKECETYLENDDNEYVVVSRSKNNLYTIYIKKLHSE
jgi:hypothetical protein